MLNIVVFLTLLILNGCIFSSQITDGTGKHEVIRLSYGVVWGKLRGDGKLEAKIPVEKSISERLPYVMTPQGYGRSRSRFTQSVLIEPDSFNPIDKNLPNLTVNSDDVSWLQKTNARSAAVLRQAGFLPTYYLASKELSEYPSEESLVATEFEIYWFKPQWENLGPATKVVFEYSHKVKPNKDLQAFGTAAMVADGIVMVPLAVASLPFGVLHSVFWKIRQDLQQEDFHCESESPGKERQLVEREQFSQSKWSNASSGERVEMFLDLGKKVNRGGPNREQILFLLGHGDREYKKSLRGEDYLQRITFFHLKGRKTSIGVGASKKKVEAAHCLELEFSFSGLLERVRVNAMPMGSFSFDEKRKKF